MVRLQKVSLDRTNQYQVGRHLALLLLLFGGRRVHDLSLLHIDSGDMVLSKHQVIFQPRLGSKTDCKGQATFVQSKQGFKSNECWALNVPAMTTTYLQITQ